MIDMAAASVPDAGFVTGVDREIFAKENPRSPDNLFAPKNKILGQETELYQRRKVGAHGPSVALAMLR